LVSAAPVETLVELMRPPTPPQVRLSAAQALLDQRSRDSTSVHVELAAQDDVIDVESS
jgi:hypothetical protein